MRKKILVLTSTFPKSGDDLQPEFVKLLSLQLRENFDVTVLAPHAPDTRAEEIVSGLNVVRFRYFFTPCQTLAYGSGILTNLKYQPVKWLLVPFFILGLLVAIIRLTRKVRYDAIHAHWIIPQGIAVIGLKLLFRQLPPVVITSHGSDLFAFDGRWGRWLKRYVLSKADAIIVVSSAMKMHCVTSLNLAQEKIDVIPMGVDLDSTFVPRPGIKRGDKDIVFVGRIVEKKGVQYLIRAMLEVIKVEPGVKLTIIGDGLMKQRLEQEVVDLQLDRWVRFLGAMSNKRLPEHLSASKIAVVPSFGHEGLGLVAVEAMGCGCVVVASDLPALRDVVIDGVTGLLVRQRDHHDLAEKLIRLLSDDMLCRELSIAGRKSVSEKFDWKDVGQRYTALLTRVIENRNHGIAAGG
ncbi:MAG: glycosyl transferase [Gammaproteobacteria bacterium]|nr:MAG: glycosyl transferase [Gammaproteobacteria bacterium]